MKILLNKKAFFIGWGIVVIRITESPSLGFSSLFHLSAFSPCIIIRIDISNTGIKYSTCIIVTLFAYALLHTRWKVVCKRIQICLDCGSIF